MGDKREERCPDDPDRRHSGWLCLLYKRMRGAGAAVTETDFLIAGSFRKEKNDEDKNRDI